MLLPNLSAISALLFSVVAAAAAAPPPPPQDDTLALQRACDLIKTKGGTLTLTAGVYRTTRPIEISRGSGFSLRAAGVTIRPLDSMGLKGGDVLRLTDCSNFSITGLTIDGNRSKWGFGPAVSLRLNGCSDFRIRDCRFTDATWDHLYLAASDPKNHKTGCHDGIIEACAFDGAHRNSISMIHAFQIRFTENTIGGAKGQDPQAGIDVEANDEDAEGANHDITIARNRFDGCAGRGIYLTGKNEPRRVTIEGNDFQNCPTAITAYGDEHRIVANRFSGGGSKELAIALAGSCGLVADNEIRDGAHIAIWSDGARNIIRDNVIENYEEPGNGYCIATDGGKGGDLIEGNVLRTKAEKPWPHPIRSHSKDVVGQNHVQTK